MVLDIVYDPICAADGAASGSVGICRHTLIP